MIRGNLATRPFYNEGLVQLWLALATIVLLAAGAYNIFQYVEHARSDRVLRRRAEEDSARAAELRARSAELRRSLDESRTRQTSAAAVEANDLIARRTFSWTLLFNRLEAALPADVRITAVRPDELAGAERSITISLAARQVSAIDAFMQNLEDADAFTNPIVLNEQVTQSGEVEGVVSVRYRPEGKMQ